MKKSRCISPPPILFEFSNGNLDDATLAKPAVCAVVGKRGCENDRFPRIFGRNTLPIPAVRNIRNGLFSLLGSSPSF
ncbi:hypothetical protein DERP_013686 [Dermatophagoides pteronyssinus]|uniref:Uncharacterized protein n=1 Tax=Dermatophagoides pteronyssinus TaxID=6956 RepID=A0ABQ8JV44_DERPT|nr:hypothetical protein DERP_013686 [Dermatophagoides pteronyssinus]